MRMEIECQINNIASNNIGKVSSENDSKGDGSRGVDNMNYDTRSIPESEYSNSNMPETFFLWQGTNCCDPYHSQDVPYKSSHTSKPSQNCDEEDESENSNESVIEDNESENDQGENSETSSSADSQVSDQVLDRFFMKLSYSIFFFRWFYVLQFVKW